VYGDSVDLLFQGETFIIIPVYSMVTVCMLMIPQQLHVISILVGWCEPVRLLVCNTTYILASDEQISIRFVGMSLPELWHSAAELLGSSENC
jgi:hypothetical protein